MLILGALTVIAAVFLGGLVKGFNGFGFAVVGTTLLASVLEPIEAVTIMIIPLIAAEFDLLSDLSFEEARKCGKNFYTFILAGIIGTGAGVMLIESIPVNIVKFGLGVVSIGFVVNRKASIPVLNHVKDKCFKKGTGMQAAIGVLGGLFFGASNIAIQVVEYLETLEIDHRTFEGLLAMVMIGFSLVRLPLSYYLGYFDSEANILLVSALAAVPGVIGVSIGERLETKVSDVVIERLTLLIITLIGFKLLLSGFGLTV